MLLDERTQLELAEAFEGEPTALWTLRHFHFISDTIERLEHVIEQHRREQLSVFDYLADSLHFQDTIHPVIHEHRRRQLPTPPVLSPISTPSDPESHDPPSETPNSSPTDSESNDSFHTAPLGSPTNPIIIPPDDDETTVAPPTRCENCTRTGHNATTCIFTGPPLCENCWNYGHYAPRCENNHVCPFCKQPGHQLPSQCGYTPFARENIPPHNAQEYFATLGFTYLG